MKSRMNYSEADSPVNEVKETYPKRSLTNKSSTEVVAEKVSSMRNFRKYQMIQNGNVEKIQAWLRVQPEVKNDNEHCMT